MTKKKKRFIDKLPFLQNCITRHTDYFSCPSDRVVFSKDIDIGFADNLFHTYKNFDSSSIPNFSSDKLENKKDDLYLTVKTPLLFTNEQKRCANIILRAYTEFYNLSVKKD